MSCWVCDYVRTGGHTQETRDLWNAWDVANMAALSLEFPPGREPQDTDDAVRLLERTTFNAFNKAFKAEMVDAHRAMREHRAECTGAECLYHNVPVCTLYDEEAA